MLHRKMAFFLYLFFHALLWGGNGYVQAQSNGNFMVNGTTPIYTSSQTGDPVHIAVLALQRDMKKIFGTEPAIKGMAEMNEPGILVLNAEKDALLPGFNGWEAHRMMMVNIRDTRHIILQGADTRGTIFSVYGFSEEVLGVPPLWYFSGWVPEKKKEIAVKASFSKTYDSPSVKYRAWFPNDTDLFDPWRAESKDNYELWLETMLRLKLNTVEWFDAERDYAKPYSVSTTTKLINNYGLVNTTHHHSPLNATFAGWNDYWRKTRDTVPPELLLSNTKHLEEFWRYNVESITRNNINMLWVIGFRGNGDHPFWYSFKDAPESMEERGEIISKMLEKQRRIVIDVTGNPQTQFRTIFYDELSDLLAKGFIRPPADPGFIWTYVAARRDHFPNEDIRQLDKNKNLRLGYYFNYQFTSTGSHLAAGEGPWKMEDNFRYVASKSSQPIAFSVVNAGNLREFMMELSANAAMMWDMETYSSDAFLKDFCRQYFGRKSAKKAALLYKKYYNAYWNQRDPEIKGFDRQFIFQDLRYKRAIIEIARTFNKPYTANPLTDIPAEQLKGRTYRIVPEDNNAANQVDAVINGTTASSKKFLSVAKGADALVKNMDLPGQAFFNDMLRQPSWYMYYLNESLLLLTRAYKETDPAIRKQQADQAFAALKNAEKALLSTQRGHFAHWYQGDRIFGFKGLYNLLEAIK